MAPTPLFWIMNKLKRRKFQERSTETLELKAGASTEKEVNQLFEESSEIGDTKMDVIKQEDQNHQCIVRSADTGCKTMDQKQVQNFLNKPKTKKLKHRLTCFWKRGVKIENKSKPSKPPVPSKNRSPKPSIPPTVEFLEYHREKHAFLKKKIKFSPKFDTILEVEDDIDEPKQCRLPTLDELRPKSSPIGQHLMEQNRNKIFLKYGYWPDEDLYYMIKHEINPPDDIRRINLMFDHICSHCF
ncbi:hypothetical protein AVEN_15880-1 [Araneus ventricosus]|uniref:Uncharacterized protein n=1 Tax=Araneus ventricosus TaxID=182803 RepID=A0A4Y2R5Z0_ARAVE|nr:hypothetical protein AVEN_2963-1 [Araneus ventricosus]GBN70866.1 hypothetical protein AVEN_8344-1 [Araneus ventricosus]GBN70876.1 hypothetical protein AVEN_260955-1 [Araneus ventricosus]GBN70878.1 hypothetical protein AVEN_15880-1 [Araneus ventricosus]